MRNAVPSTTNELVRQFTRDGWEVTPSRRHLQARHPGGGLITLPHTCANRRAYRNLLSIKQRIEREGAA